MHTEHTNMPEAGKKTYGLLARFDDPADLLAAARKVREAGYRRFDCHSPFPIHGMDEAMAMPRSPLGYAVGFMALAGLVGMTLFIWWITAVDYPLVISGKPYFSYQAFVPIIFAITILFAAITATFGMMALTHLPRPFHPLFHSRQFDRVTVDGFFLSLEAEDPTFEIEKAKGFLQSIGGKDVEVVYDE
jgi:hypothetical protein